MSLYEGWKRNINLFTSLLPYEFCIYTHNKCKKWVHLTTLKSANFFLNDIEMFMDGYKYKNVNSNYCDICTLYFYTVN